MRKGLLGQPGVFVVFWGVAHVEHVLVAIKKRAVVTACRNFSMVEWSKKNAPAGGAGRGIVREVWRRTPQRDQA